MASKQTKISVLLMVKELILKSYFPFPYRLGRIKLTILVTEGEGARCWDVMGCRTF